jgi:hypothetical protein
LRGRSAAASPLGGSDQQSSFAKSGWISAGSHRNASVALERRVRLEVSAFHNVAQLLKATVLIRDGGNEPFQCVYAVSEIVALDLLLRAEIPDTSLCRWAEMCQFRT